MPRELKKTLEEKAQKLTAEKEELKAKCADLERRQESIRAEMKDTLIKDIARMDAQLENVGVALAAAEETLTSMKRALGLMPQQQFTVVSDPLGMGVLCKPNVTIPAYLLEGANAEMEADTE